jgi:2-methylaconitate cis-trans-isomerase PrpF
MRRSNGLLIAAMAVAFTAFVPGAMTSQNPIKVVKAGLSKLLIREAVKQYPGTHGASPDEFTSLRAVGASDAVISPLVQSDLALRFVPVLPCRIADTRNPNGSYGGPPIAGGTSRDFVIPNSSCGIPSSAQAYALNVTVVPHDSLGYLTVWPTGQTQPFVSTLNSLDGRIKANAAIVPAGADGAISVYATHATDLVLDINGYFVPAGTSGALAFYPRTPCRVADTRNANGTLGGPVMSARVSRTFPIQSSPCNIPTGALAYSLNFTVVPRGPLGYLTTWPTGNGQPLVSTLNALTGGVTANAAIVPAGTSGSIDVYVTDDTDLVIDINGYFAPAGTGGLSLYNAAPCRVLDTRLPSGSPPFTGQRDMNVVGGSCAVPAAAQAYVFNATVVPSVVLGFLTLWPQGQSQPLVSTLNALDGAITSNMAIVPTTNGASSAFVTDSTQLVLDISGYFAPSAALSCGALLQSNIAAGAQVDQYTFDGQANRIITLTLANNGGWPYYAAPVATLLAPSGAQVVSFQANGQRQIPLVESGRYVVQVRASDFASTGQYGFGLVCRNPAALETALSCGALSQGGIAAGAQVDQYTFDGQANRIVTLTLANTGGWPYYAAPVATLLAPSGTQVESFQANGQRQITLTENGTYVVQVRASDFASTGQYGFGLECRNPAALATALSCGTLPQGNIAAGGQVDQYTFDGQANRIVTLTLANTGGWPYYATPVATLLTPSGAQVESFHANGQRQITLTENGTYVVQVRASDFASTGQYGFGLECRNPPALVKAVLTCGALPQGNIAAGGQVDQYTFDGQANRIVTLTLANTGGWPYYAAPVAALFAPSGTQVVSFQANGQRQTTLTENGTYVVQVRASDFASTGQYGVGLQCP